MLRFLDRVNRWMAARLRVRLLRTDRLYPWQIAPRRRGPMDAAALPPGAADRLRPDDPELAALKERYRGCDPAVTTPYRWTEDHLSAADLVHFRGDNAFVWQNRRRDDNELSAALCYHALKDGDREGLLARLGEDRMFGVHAHEIDGRLVSRDLIDSAREIQFLIRHAGLGGPARSVLDIGAGYGRLAWRIDEAFGGEVRVFAADAFAASTFLCDHYLRFRGARGARAVPLDEVEALMARERIDLAVNVHSFSECTLEAVAWWVELVARSGVPLLMIVPNELPGAGGRCLLNDGSDFAPVLARFGYRQRLCEPRYADPAVQRYGLDPVHLHLFERAA